MRQSLRPAHHKPGDAEHAERIYRHRWVVRLHRRTYPDKTAPTGKARRWIGPYLVTPVGCEDAQILGTERVNVLRR
ncbi:hypothetical protein [Kitasatospora sp. NPDC093679]|uniref:hypothetical protein n=1 Tax=Kitasatospora sp. NPDC093679 TaxID=3154983 RepID=UPI00342E22E7